MNKTLDNVQRVVLGLAFEAVERGEVDAAVILLDAVGLYNHTADYFYRGEPDGNVSDNKIRWIKWHRERFGSGLKEAVDAHKARYPHMWAR